MTNPKAGHTSATGYGSNAQGLRDGDGLTSPSLTNVYEGIHGNGIIRLEDGAVGDSLRNSIVANTPGFIEIGASRGELKVYGGYCVIDGVLYQFAGGPSASETFTVGTSTNYSGDLPSPPGAESDVYVVVYLVGRDTPNAHLHYEMGTPVSAANGVPLIPNRFLSSTSVTGDTDLNHQNTVIAVVRYTMSASAGSVNAALNLTPTIHDKRTYVRNSPIYLTPMTKGGVGNLLSSNSIDSAGDLDGLFVSPEDGDFSGSHFGALWQSHNPGDHATPTPNVHAMLYYSAPRNLNTTPVSHTHRLGPDMLEIITTTGDITFTFDQANIWIVTTDAARTINPTGTFPPGHTVEIYHKAGAHTLHFDSTVGGHSTGTKINQDIANGECGKFVYDGADWHKLNLNTVS